MLNSVKVNLGPATIGSSRYADGSVFKDFQESEILHNYIINYHWHLHKLRTFV